MNLIRKAAFISVLALLSVFLDGCSSAQVGAKPEDKLNSALSPHQKQILSARQQQNGQ